MSEHHLRPAVRIGCSVGAAVLAVPLTLLTWYLLLNASSHSSVGPRPAAVIAGVLFGLCAGAPWAYSRGSWRPLAWTAPLGAILVLGWLLLWQAGAMQ